MLTLTNPEEFSPPPKPTEADKLRERLDELVGEFSAYPQDMVGRALLAKGADTLLESDGPFAARWAVSRVQDLLTGFWVPDTVRSFVESYQK